MSGDWQDRNRRRMPKLRGLRVSQGHRTATRVPLNLKSATGGVGFSSSSSPGNDALYRGTASVVPNSPEFVGFSPRYSGIAAPDSLTPPKTQGLKPWGSTPLAARLKRNLQYYPTCAETLAKYPGSAPAVFASPRKHGNGISADCCRRAIRLFLQVPLQTCRK